MQSSVMRDIRKLVISCHVAHVACHVSHAIQTHDSGLIFSTSGTEMTQEMNNWNIISKAMPVLASTARCAGTYQKTTEKCLDKSKDVREIKTWSHD